MFGKLFTNKTFNTVYNNIPQKIFIAGMGGSAMAGTLLQQLMPHLNITVTKDYKTESQRGDLVIACSYSGNTEETLSAVYDAVSKGCTVYCITSGGKLEEYADQHGLHYILVDEGYQPRAALPLMFTALYSIFEQYDFSELAEYLQIVGASFEKETSLARSIAELFHKKLPLVYTDASFEPIGIRWRNQLNENSKMFALNNVLPELCHNEIVPDGKHQPLDTGVVVIEDKLYNDRIEKRIRILKEHIWKSVIVVSCDHKNKLFRYFYYILLGDYVSYFLAELNNEDSVTVTNIDLLKEKLGPYL